MYYPRITYDAHVTNKIRVVISDFENHTCDIEDQRVSRILRNTQRLDKNNFEKITELRVVWNFRLTEKTFFFIFRVQVKTV